MAETPRPKRAEGQWGFGYKEPLTRQEQNNRDEVENVLNLYKQRRDGVSPFGAWINTLSDSEVSALAQEAAKGLARVGPAPVAEIEDIRPYD